jgi:hypothetical protein
MEYLALMAAFFLPLTLFTVRVSYRDCSKLVKGVFGMHIQQLVSDAIVTWRVVVAVTIPTAIIFFLAVYLALGKPFWPWTDEGENNNDSQVELMFV